MDLSGDTTVSSYVAINTASKTAAPAEEFTLSITKIGDGTVTWSSSDPAIAEVQGAGLSAKVIAKKSGDATITANVAAAGNYQAGSAKCAVAVRVSTLDQLNAELSAEVGEVSVYLADNANFTFTGKYSIKNKKFNIIGSKSSPATITLGTDAIEVNNGFKFENVIFEGAALENTEDISKSKPLIRMSDPQEAGVNSKGYFETDIEFNNVTVNNLKAQFFAINKKKFFIKNFTFNNGKVVINGTGKKSIFDFTNEGFVGNINITNSIAYAKGTNQFQNGSFLSTQSSKNPSEVSEDAQLKQNLTLTDNRFYNIAPSNHFCNFRGANKDFLYLVVKDNKVADCGKKGQFIVGITNGSIGKDYKGNWTASGNVVNHTNEDQAEAENTKAGLEGACVAGTVDVSDLK